MAKASNKAKARAMAKHIYSTGVTYDRHLRSPKILYSTGQ